MNNLSVDCAVDVIQTGATAGQTAVTSSALSMAGYDGILILCQLGTVSAGSVLSLQLQDCATSGGTYGNVGSPAAVTDVGGATSNGVIVLDVVNVQKAFVEAVLSRGTANAVVNSMIAIRYRSKNRPVVQGSTAVAKALSNAAA